MNLESGTGVALSLLGLGSLDSKLLALERQRREPKVIEEGECMFSGMEWSTVGKSDHWNEQTLLNSSVLCHLGDLSQIN